MGIQDLIATALFGIAVTFQGGNTKYLYSDEGWGRLADQPLMVTNDQACEHMDRIQFGLWDAPDQAQAYADRELPDLLESLSRNGPMPKCTGFYVFEVKLHVNKRSMRLPKRKEVKG